MTKDEALKLALEALEDISSHYMSLPKKGCMALAAIEEALAEQETVLPGGGHVPAVPVAVYGYCPECGGAGVMRERRPNGDDKCTNGHKYPSSKALAEQPAHQEPEKDWGAVAEKHLAALKQSSKAITEEAAVNAVHKMAQARGLIDIGRIFTPEKEQPYPDNFIDALKYDVARRDSEALAEQPAKEKAPQSANCEAPGWINSDHTRRDDCNTEQPAQQQGPVAWLHTKIEGVAVPHRPADLDKHPDRWTALYPESKPCPTCEALARTVMMDQTDHDAQRKPLTDEEIDKIPWEPHEGNPMTFAEGLRYFARAIEAAHGIKE